MERKEIDTEAEIILQTKKWLEKAKEEMQNAVIKDESKADALRNAKNYIKDCSSFIEKNDWVRAFEAVIYAYGILDTLKRLGIIEIEEKS